MIHHEEKIWLKCSPGYFYLLNVFLGTWIILNYFSHTVFVLLLSALRFQGWLCRAAHGRFTAQNPRGSLRIYLLSVAYFHTVTHCGLICQLPPGTQCTERLHSPVLRDLSGQFPSYLERRCHGWLWEEPFSHQSLHFFSPYHWRHAEYLPLFCFRYCPSILSRSCGSQVGFERGCLKHEISGVYIYP